MDEKDAKIAEMEKRIAFFVKNAIFTSNLFFSQVSFVYHY